jgi:hypothetical protein
MKPLRLASGLLLALLPALLAGCGFFDSEERAPWRAQEEAACYARNLVPLTPYIRTSGPIEGKGICGLDRPLRVSALADGSISLGSRALALSCPMTAALQVWVRDAVMPAALERYGAPVVEILNAGTYNCRSRNNIPGAALSEHAFANAFDFTGARLANGYVVTVRKGWAGSATDRAFLREITAAACGPFKTVLGPGSDGKHEDHLHLDLAHHNAKGTYRYCKPRPNVPLPTSPLLVAGASPALPGAAGAPVPSYPMSQASPGFLANTGSSGFDQPLPPESLPASGAMAAPRAAYRSPVAVAPEPQQPAGCPPGYICTPVGAPSATPPPPAGWSVGPRPIAGYDDVETTGSIGGNAYTDD